MPIYRLEDRTPEIDPSCYIAPSADVIGSVRMAKPSQRLVQRGTTGRQRSHHDRRKQQISRTTPLFIPTPVYRR